MDRVANRQQLYQPKKEAIRNKKVGQSPTLSRMLFITGKSQREYKDKFSFKSGHRAKTTLLGYKRVIFIISLEPWT